MTHHASLLALFIIFIWACTQISEWAAHHDKVEIYRPRIVRTIAIDTDTEIERQEGWR